MKKQKGVNILLVSMLLISLLTACKKSSIDPNLSKCGVENPAENLPWLRSMIDEAKSEREGNYLTVTMFEFKGNTYFHYYLNISSCWGCRLYDCTGEPAAENLSEADAKLLREVNIAEVGTVIWGKK